MKLEQVYDGRFFPCYYYEPNVITVAVTSKAEPADTEHITWLLLPMEREEIDRALLRGGITDPADVRLRLEDSQLPNEVDVLLDMKYENLSDLNELAQATDGLSKADMEKLGAVVTLAEPKSAAQIKNLAESLDLFDFAPGTHTEHLILVPTLRSGSRYQFEKAYRQLEYDGHPFTVGEMSRNLQASVNGWLKWLGYTVELFFDGQWFNIDQWHRHANGELRHRYLYTAPERDIFSSAHDELALSKERICFSDLAAETQDIICAENPAFERSTFDSWDFFI